MLYQITRLYPCYYLKVTIPQKEPLYIPTTGGESCTFVPIQHLADGFHPVNLERGASTLNHCATHSRTQVIYAKIGVFDTLNQTVQ